MALVLVTGANSGIGFALLQHFIAKSDRVIGIDRDVSRIQSLPQVEAVQLDLTNLMGLHQCWQSNNWQIDVLVNCAGIREIEPVLELSIEKWQQVMAVNLTAPFLLSQLVAQYWVANDRMGSIINMASISGLAVEPNRAAYCSSKHGLVGLTKQMAMDLAPLGIRVNAIAPGVVETELTASYFDDEQQVALIKSNTPLRRWAQPAHIIQAVESLLVNDMMTGHVMVVDGGWTLGKQL